MPCDLDDLGMLFFRGGLSRAILCSLSKYSSMFMVDCSCMMHHYIRFVLHCVVTGTREVDGSLTLF